MRHFIVATHAYLAKGFESSINLILGERDDLKVFNAYVEQGVFYKDELLKEINTYDDQDEVIIMTDMFGGSVNNELMELTRNPRVHLVTGTNLILLISILLSSENDDVSEVISRNIKEAQNGIIYCNQLSSDDSSLDDF